jgi:hypothetical protein
MFVDTMWTLTRKCRAQGVNRPIAGVTILLLILSTVVSFFSLISVVDLMPFKHMIVDVARIEDGLVKYRDTFPGGPPAFFADVAQGTFVVKNVIYVMQTLLGDGVVVSPIFIR